jgi:hypothetical protein
MVGTVILFFFLGGGSRDQAVTVRSVAVAVFARGRADAAAIAITMRPAAVMAAPIQMGEV